VGKRRGFEVEQVLHRDAPSSDYRA
jgi:hypothetical protein